MNDIIYLLPKLKRPMTELMEAVTLKNAAKGNKDTMWTDPERYPTIADANKANILAPRLVFNLNLSLCQAIQVLESDLFGELKKSKCISFMSSDVFQC